MIICFAWLIPFETAFQANSTWNCLPGSFYLKLPLWAHSLFQTALISSFLFQTALLSSFHLKLAIYLFPNFALQIKPQLPLEFFSGAFPLKLPFKVFLLLIWSHNHCCLVTIIIFPQVLYKNNYHLHPQQFFRKSTHLLGRDSNPGPLDYQPALLTTILSCQPNSKSYNCCNSWHLFRQNLP